MPSGVGAVGVGPVRFANSSLLDSRLRGRTLSHESLGRGGLESDDADEVLAYVGDRPAWVKRRVSGEMTDVLAFGPGRLEAGGFLRDEVAPGRFFRLLPLIHFLRDVCTASAWESPPTRAAFVIDDPNLHWRSYGYLRYPELVRHAREWAYHAVMAMIPLDCWYAHGSTVRLFHKNADVVSLCIHGNNHTSRELEQPGSRQDARALLAQSVRRIERFERRTGLHIARVMVPPHEACSSQSMSVMLDVGFEAACISRAYPWMPFGASDSPYNTPVAGHVLSGWRVAELLSDGFPVIARRGIDEYDEIVLRSYLDQPVVLYGHVSDLAGGLERLAAAAAVVNSVPGAKWGSLEDIARSNFETRREGDILHLRPFARRVRVSIGPDIAAIHVRKPDRVSGFSQGVCAAIDGSLDGCGIDGDIIELPHDRSETAMVEVMWGPRHALTSPRIPASFLSAPAVARRLLTEARDRLQPFVRSRARLA